MLLVVGELDGTAPVRLPDRVLDRLRLLVGVHEDLAVHVARGASDRLDEGRPSTQEALLVRVEDGDERDLGQVEPLAQQVDADEHVVLAETQLAHDLDALERVDLGVQVARFHAGLEQVVREILRHLLRQRRDERALSDCLTLADLPEEVVDLVPRRAKIDARVDDARRADELLRHAGRVTLLVRPGRRRDEDHLWHLREELVETERPVVERRRKPEPEVDQRLLARAIALVHAADLRDRLVRLVDEHDVVGREVVEQRVRRRSRWPAVEDARVVLDPVAEAQLLHHLEVVLGALP